MHIDLLLDIDICEDIAVACDEDIVQTVLHQFHGPGGAPGLVLIGVDYPDTEVGTVPEGLHMPRFVSACEDDLLDACAGQ